MVTKVDLLGCCVQFLVLYFEMHFKSGGDYGKGTRARALDSGSKPKTLTGSFSGRKTQSIKGMKVLPAFFMRGHSMKREIFKCGEWEIECCRASHPFSNFNMKSAAVPASDILCIVRFMYTFPAKCKYYTDDRRMHFSLCRKRSAIEKPFLRQLLFAWPPSFHYQGKRWYDKIVTRHQYL